MTNGKRMTHQFTDEQIEAAAEDELDRREASKVSDVSKTNEALIAEARKAERAVYLATEEAVAKDISRIIKGLADALATRVPVQGEPNDDREALASVEAELAEWLSGKRSWCDQHHGLPNEIELTAKADEATIRLLIIKRDALASRATVPDAATVADEYAYFARQTLAEVEAERDAALAAVELVRAVAKDWERDEDAKGLHFDLVAALAGAPEPEEPGAETGVRPWADRFRFTQMDLRGGELKLKQDSGLPVEGESDD